jgi:hypothetical protein
MHEGYFEHLVVELKRPSVKLGKKEISQIEEYAYKVADDSRFDKERTQWTFVLIGNDLDDFAKRKCTSPDRPFGQIQVGPVTIYVRTWATAIADARWRYDFFRKQLDYQATTDDARAFLNERYAKYFPTTAAKQSRVDVPAEAEMPPPKSRAVKGLKVKPPARPRKAR